jgi:hypothetical protein
MVLQGLQWFLALPFEISGVVKRLLLSLVATPTACKILPHTPWLWLLMERHGSVNDFV